MSKKKGGGFFHGPQPGSDHFKNTQLIRRAEAVFDGPNDTVRMLQRPLEIEPCINDMLQSVWSRQRAIFRDVADKKCRSTRLLGPEEQLSCNFPNLTDAAGRHLEFFAECRLNGVDDYHSSLSPFGGG